MNSEQRGNETCELTLNRFLSRKSKSWNNSFGGHLSDLQNKNKNI